MSEVDFDKALADSIDTPFSPMAWYDEDGDCIEFFCRREPFYAVRKDALLTVYYSQATHEIVGSLIKRVQSILKRYPGIRFDVVNGKTRLVHVVRANAWQVDDPELYRAYDELIRIVDESGADVQLCH